MALAPRWIVFWASAAERMPPAATMENRWRTFLPTRKRWTAGITSVVG